MFDSNFEEFPGVFYVYFGYWREYLADDMSTLVIPTFNLWYY